MRLRILPAVLVGLILLMTSGCGRPTSDVSADELKSVVARNIVRFDGEGIPAAVTDTLAEYQVLIVGEYHQASGSVELAGALALALRGKGLRQVLLECPHAYSWMLDAYVQGRISKVRGITPTMYLPLLDQIRSANAGLASAERIHVAAIDINHSYMDLRISLECLASLVDRPDLATQFLSEVARTDNRNATRAMQQRMAADSNGLGQLFGLDCRDTVMEMLDFEAASTDLRGKVGGSGAATTERERLMKQLIDRRLSEAAGSTLIYTGFYHAQKTTCAGTEDEFFGRYLHYSSPYAKGKCFSLVLVPVSGDIQLGSSARSIDAGKSPENDLFRVMSTAAGDDMAFLYLNDPLFAERKVLTNYWAFTAAVPPSSQFDGLITLPNVTVVPVPEG